ncbi:MAG: ribosomal protein S18-alanine N-acetyltransferase [Deltaproteobacteria bacterium]
MTDTELIHEKNDKPSIWKRSRGWIRIGEDPTNLAELDKSCFKKAWREESFSKLMNYPWFRAWTWHTAANSEALGFLIVEDQTDLFSILRIGVVPEYQRQGIGREMMDFLIQLARNEQVPKILLEVHEFNLAAQHLYFASGFCQIHLKKDYYRDPPGNALVLTKAIS